MRTSDRMRDWRWAPLGPAWLSVAVVAVVTTGCVANQDVKTASTEVTKTLGNVRGAEQDFNDAVLAELEQTRAQVARAIVAGIVYRKIGSIADDLEAKGNLIGLSREISEAQQRGELFVDRISSAKLPENVDTVKISDWLAATSSKAPIAAPGPTPAPSPAPVPASTSAPDILGQLGVPEAQVRTLLRVRQMEVRTKAGLLNELDQHVNAIAALHAQVDQWIQTDVTVKGEDVAKVIEAVAQQFPKASVKQ